LRGRTSESGYQRKLLKKLNKIPGAFFFSKEAKSIRGLPDIIGCVSGRMVMLEVKKSAEEYEKWDKRQYLQNHVLENYKSAGAYTAFIYPECEKYIIEDLQRM
jgi:hypothetical protein